MSFFFILTGEEERIKRREEEYHQGKKKRRQIRRQRVKNPKMEVFPLEKLRGEGVEIINSLVM